MDELTVFNTALTPFNIELTDLDSKPDEKSVRLCRRLLPDAIRMAQREHNWTFLTVRLDMDYTDDSEGVGCGGYSHGYLIPSGVFKIVDTEPGVSHRVIGPRYCTDTKDPEVYGMMKTISEEGVPDDFWTLVSYALAYLLAPSIAPGSQLSDEILRRYTWVAQGLISDEAKNNRYED